MRNAVWVALAWLAITLVTAIGTEWRMGYVMPEVAVIVGIFLAFERDAVPLVVCCLALGYLIGRQSLAPIGLHEISLAVTALGFQLVMGNIAGGGRGFFASCVAAATVAYQGLVFLLLLIFRGNAAFPSWTATALVPAALLTGFLALLFHPLMIRLDRRLSPVQRESLSF